MIPRDAKNFVEPAALARLRAFSWLSRDQVEGLARSLEAVKVPRHQRIFMEGEMSSHVYVLLSGVAKLSFLHHDEKVLVGLVGPGEVFGVSSLLPNATRPFRCEAFSDCTVGIGKPSTFVGLTLGVPLERFSRTLEVTVGRWWAMLQRYTNFVGLTLRERLAGALLELAAKFGAEDARGVILTLKLTHSDLAELVGASRQRTTEQLIEFESERMIIRDGRRLIIVPERLRDLTDADELRSVERADGRAVADGRRKAHGAR
ncbi:MAG TPA: Crp/Fnr family transcriptional regulator [Candidatus Binataceae bacterium]|nr:Crp/Fnr family transcriptional regulator [Candidatus Binataceae bacterium]